MKKLILLTLTGAFILQSCKDSKEAVVNVGDSQNVNTELIQRITFEPKTGEDKGQYSISDLIDTMFMVPLSNEVLVAQIEKVRVHQELIFLFDARAQNIMIFDFSGKLINKIDNKGKGPGEYVKIADFEIDTYGDQILILDQFNRKVIQYSLEGLFQKEQRYITHARYLAPIGPDRYLIYNDFNSRWQDGNYNLFITKSDGEVLANMLAFDEKYKMTSRAKDNYFNFHNEDTVNYIGHYDNHVYRVTKDSAWVSYFLDFGQYNLPKEVIHDSFNALDGYVNNISNFFETSDFLSFSYLYNKELWVRYYDKVNEQVVDWPLTVEDLTFFNINFPVKTVYKNYFVNFVDASYYPKLFKYDHLVPDSGPYVHFVDTLEKVEEEDNPILFFFKMRSMKAGSAPNIDKKTLAQN